MSTPPSEEAARTAGTVVARAASVGAVAAAIVCVRLAAPADFTVRVVDETGRPVEAVVVRVVRSSDPNDFQELYSDVAGEVRARVDGVRKAVDVVVNPPGGKFAPAAHECDPTALGTGPNYASGELCAVPASSYAPSGLVVRLEDRLPTRQICRLTGRGASNGPYQYAGHDSAITVPWVHGAQDEHEDLLWWFGDTTDEPGGEIFVPNKMASSDGDAAARACVELRYLGPRDAAVLPVDRSVETEATVWLDVPLVSTSAAGDRPHGAYAFHPRRGDRLHVGYLSVEDTQPFFKITHLGLATLEACAEDCEREFGGTGPRLRREPAAVWSAPVEYARAPEGGAFAFGDEYTILKVVERRTYCEAPPHDVDCAPEHPCPDGGRCIEPGKFCDAKPHVACLEDGDCAHGRCVAGGVVAMRVARDRVTDKGAYRYWNAESETFEPFAGREPDAILVDATLGNSVSVMWSEFLSRWVLISNEEAVHYVGQSRVTLRTARELLGPWSEPRRIMENLGGQRSYNPRFVPAYTRTDAPQLVYWTATYDAYDESWPTHGMDFDYNVFLYETDLARLAQSAGNTEETSAGSTRSSRLMSDQENDATSSRAVHGAARSSSPSDQARSPTIRSAPPPALRSARRVEPRSRLESFSRAWFRTSGTCA